MTDVRRTLPSVGSLLESDGVRTLLERAPRGVVVNAIRSTIEEARLGTPPADATEWTRAISVAVETATRPSLRRVINGTGVVLHTNLGRAPLPAAAVAAVARVASGFSNLELDVESGARGSRYTHCAQLLRELTGAEDAIVVNNCAAALVLALNTFADGRDAIVSRGELVEIGGSFRIPDIMAKSGATLVEVGTTNRTNIDDYRRAIGATTGAIVKVHRSNFAISGFVAEVSSSELGALAAERKIPLLHDLGSGLLVSLADYGLSGEPTAADAVRNAGPNAIITMSGDKLLGGPQAGVILGAKASIDSIRKNPLTRSYRVDKLTLAALEATLALYREPERARRDIPVLAQLTASMAELRERGERIARQLAMPAVTVVESRAGVGGGAFPTAEIPSIALSIAGRADAIEQRLRAGDPPLVARVANGCVLIDLRTVFPAEDAEVVAAVRGAVS
ncbi:MAG: L-seryl-tRNA(Sec) selenium transferase [Gemmatimonadaceae bacterium]